MDSAARYLLGVDQIGWRYVPVPPPTPLYSVFHRSDCSTRDVTVVAGHGKTYNMITIPIPTFGFFHAILSP